MVVVPSSFGFGGRGLSGLVDIVLCFYGDQLRSLIGLPGFNRVRFGLFGWMGGGGTLQFVYVPKLLPCVLVVPIF